MKKGQNILGFIVLIAILFVGDNYLKSSMLFFRLLVGMGFGYALTRSFMGLQEVLTELITQVLQNL